MLWSLVGMTRRWIQLIVLALVVALFAGSQCSAFCLLSTTASPSSCPQHSHSHRSLPDHECDHQHLEYFSPEHCVDVEKNIPSTSSGAGLALLADLSWEQSIIPVNEPFWSVRDRGAPPGTKTYLAVSILRL